MPPELLEAHTFGILGIPLAGSWSELQDVPARLVDDSLIIKAGYEDAEEWRELDAVKAGTRGGNK